MLGDKDVTVVLPVKNLQAASNFYEQTLGLKKADQNPGGILYNSGNSKLFIYETQFAGTNQATAAAWVADDVKATVAALEQKGVAFEQYDLPGATREGAVHVMGSMHAAWFKDPDGNILNIVNMPS